MGIAQLFQLLVQHAQNPKFDPQHDINQAW